MVVDPTTPITFFKIAKAATDFGKSIFGKKKPDLDTFDQELSRTIVESLRAFREIDSMGVDELERAAIALMDAINAVVFAYHRPGAPKKWADLDINSCYMIPLVSADASGLIKKAMFTNGVEQLEQKLWAVLSLRLWANPGVNLPTDLVLPILDPNDAANRKTLLPGAPQAFVMSRAEVIDDALKPKRRPRRLPFGKKVTPGRFFIHRETPLEVFTVIKEYFEGKQDHIRSFASIPLSVPPEDRDRIEPAYRDIPLAVLTIQSNRPCVFGRKACRRDFLLMRIFPLTEMLSRYICKIILARGRR